LSGNTSNIKRQPTQKSWWYIRYEY
jgi:hypothetical protein